MDFTGSNYSLSFSFLLMLSFCFYFLLFSLSRFVLSSHFLLGACTNFVFRSGSVPLFLYLVLLCFSLSLFCSFSLSFSCSVSLSLSLPISLSLTHNTHTHTHTLLLLIYLRSCRPKRLLSWSVLQVQSWTVLSLYPYYRNISVRVSLIQIVERERESKWKKGTKGDWDQD